MRTGEVVGEVKLVRVPPMRVVAFHAYGLSPEDAAWQQARVWAAPRGLLQKEGRQIVGFDNPPPPEGSREHGYEYWIELKPGEPTGEDVTVKEFGGGLYAVLPCPMEGHPWRTVPAGWHKLDGWVQAHGYAFGDHQHFERPRDPDASPAEMVLELYCPIREKPSLYDFPDVYDAVMGRPAAVVETEVRSVLGLRERLAPGGRRVLELACGACAHGLRLAQVGCRVTGLDRSAAMLARAQREAAAAGVTLETVQGDVVDFDLPARDFDAALFLFETFPLITDYADLARHFAAVRRHLRPGGIYIVDVDRSYGIRTQTGEWGRRTIPLPNGAVEVWNEDLPGDWVEGVNRMVLHCRIELDGQTYQTEDAWTIRVYTPWTLALLARTLPGWSLDGFYSWQTLSREIATEQHYWMVLKAQ
jgi:SAM-dependent methyltransferase